MTSMWFAILCGVFMLGVILGGALGWLLRGQRAARADAELQLRAEQARSQEHHFKSLASDVLRDASQQFLQLAEQRFQATSQEQKHLLEAGQKTLQDGLQPFHDNILLLQQKLQQLEQQRGQSDASLQQQLLELQRNTELLRHEAHGLKQALRSPGTRGRWGEMQLRRVVELAGMVERCDFSTQLQMQDDDQQRRPDLVIHLPGGRSLVVDAKTPLDAYLNANESQQDHEREQWLQRHAEHLALHVRKLSDKNYFRPLDAVVDMTIMFLPDEGALSAATRQLPSLLDDAMQKRILLATPTILMALLRAVAYGWRQENITDNAHKVLELASRLQDGLASFTGHYAKIGRALGSAVDEFNVGLGSLERNVLARARKIAEIPLSAHKPLADIPEIEKHPRSIVEK